jgi:prevent-host-death family protein
MNWQLQEAKSKFSQVVREAQTSGPQVITVHGKEAVVVLSTEEYKHLTHSQGSLAEFLHNSPLRSSGLMVERDQELGRDLEL